MAKTCQIHGNLKKQKQLTFTPVLEQDGKFLKDDE
jgi:hypothetical protein